MSAAALLLDQLRAKGVRVAVVGSDLRVEALPGVVTSGERDQLTALKPALLDLLGVQTRVVLVDFETRSLAKLKAIGPRAYMQHESTEVLCAVFKTPGGRVLEWNPSLPVPAELFALVAGGVPVASHNVGFDRFAWLKLGWPEPARWVDTLVLAKMAAYPERSRSLDALGHILLGQRKDEEGGDFTLSLSKPDRKTKALRPLAPGDLQRVRRYCAQDVELLGGIYGRLAVHDRHEPEVRAVDRQINDRGFLFDTDLARAVIDCDAECRRRARENAGVSSDVLSSPAKLKRALLERGVDVASVCKTTLSQTLRENISDEARALIDARFTSAPIAAKKLQTALRRVGSDNRMRDSLVYYAAHTGRWGGRGFQPQNLPRGVSGIDIDRLVEAALQRDVGALRDLAKQHGASLVDMLSSLVRPCVVAPEGKSLGVVDYSQIEARALAWLAYDSEAMQLFREGRDPYKTLAAKLFNVAPEQVTPEQRKLGKIAELGCGYGMGAERFSAQAAGAGVDWGAANVTPEQVVETWRDTHSAIAGLKGEGSSGSSFRSGGLWQELQNAAIAATRGRRVEVGPLTFGKNGDCVVCVLPSGRRMVYRDARIETLPNQRSKRPGFTYLSTRGQRESGYGGKLAENVTQALCRDILAESLVRLERAGFPVVLHVHDEIVVELGRERQVNEMRDLMTLPPSWARDVPLAAEAHSTRRYSK